MSEQRLNEMINALKERGHRITPQRLAVLKILSRSINHPSVETIFHEIKKDFPTTSLATVYKTVTLLKELNQILELGFADWGSRYDGARPQPHPHVICTKCGKIVDPDSTSLADIAREMADKSGFEINTHRLDFFGLCPDCQRK